MADREATPGLSFNLLYINSMCMCVSVYWMYVWVCLCVHVFVCMWRMCVRIFQLFLFQVAYRMKIVLCVYDCVRACVYVCVCMANRCTHMFNSLGSEGVKGQRSKIFINRDKQVGVLLIKYNRWLIEWQIKNYADPCIAVLLFR